MVVVVVVVVAVDVMSMLSLNSLWCGILYIDVDVRLGVDVDVDVVPSVDSPRLRWRCSRCWSCLYICRCCGCDVMFVVAVVVFAMMLTTQS